jgi:hypothetical protein
MGRKKMLNETIVDEDFIEAMNVYREKPDGKSLFEACSESIILFSEYMLGIKLRSWQIKMLTEIQKAIEGKVTNRHYLTMTSRQIGKTTGLSILASWVCTFNKRAGGLHNNSEIAVISITDEQAKKVVRDIKNVLRRADRYMEKMYKDDDNKPRWPKFFSKLVDDKGANNTTTISFRAYNEGTDGLLLKDSEIGSTIRSFPPTSIILGNTYGLVLIDEAGKVEKMKDNVYYDYILPTTDETDAILVYTSTPWEPLGFFYKIANPADEYTDEEEDVVKLMFTLDAIEIEAPERYKRIKRKLDKLVLDGKKDEVDRGYYCKFVKGERSYFNPEDVRKAFTKDAATSSYSLPCDLGVDFGGQVTSRTVLTVTALEEDGTIRRLWHKAYEVGKDLNLISDIETEVLPFFNIQRIIPDDCPAGQYLIPQMIEKGWDVNPMKFRTDKVKKYGAFRSALRKGKFISYDDFELQREMIAMEFSHGSRQSVIQHAAGYTDDLIDSLVMSAYFFVEDEGSAKIFSWDDVE